MSAVVRVPVWDIPVRVFHWSLVVLVGACWLSGENGWLDWHMRFGYAALTLVLFRVVWGVIGSQHARFSDFVRGPQSALAYVRGQIKPLGHNPLGGWMVLMLLALLLVQTGTGLFASDGILSEGPLYGWVSSSVSDTLTTIHKLGFNLLLLCVGLHVAAVVAYKVVKKENLVKPMLTGYKELPADAVPTPVRGFKPWWWALGVFIASATCVGLLVTRAAG